MQAASLVPPMPVEKPFAPSAIPAPAALASAPKHTPVLPDHTVVKALPHSVAKAPAPHMPAPIHAPIHAPTMPDHVAKAHAPMIEHSMPHPVALEHTAPHMVAPGADVDHEEHESLLPSSEELNKKAAHLSEIASEYSHAAAEFSSAAKSLEQAEAALGKIKGHCAK